MDAIILSPGDQDVLTERAWSKSGYGYWRANIRCKKTKRRSPFKLHRYIILRRGIKIPEGYTVDHINRNKDDNRRENLRFATRTAQQLNKHRKPYYIRGEKRWKRVVV